MTYRNFFAGLAVACLGMAMISAPALAMATRGPDGGSGTDTLSMTLSLFGAASVVLVLLGYYGARHLGLVCAVLIAGSLAFAFPVSAAVAPDGTTINAGGVVSFLTPYILDVLGVVVMAFITFASAKLQKYTSIKVSDDFRSTLHSAAMTGASAALAKANIAAADFKVDVHSNLVADGIRWIETSVPDAIKGLGVTPATMAQLVLSKIQLLAETGTTPAPSQIGSMPVALVEPNLTRR